MSKKSFSQTEGERPGSKVARDLEVPAFLDHAGRTADLQNRSRYRGVDNPSGEVRLAGPLPGPLNLAYRWNQV